MSTGGKCVKSRVPSIPSQLKVWCGIRLTWFHEIFCVRNQRLPADLDDLRQGGGVAEGVRKPGFAAFDAELVEEEALALDELPGHGLPAGHVGVRFHPHAAHRHELAGFDLLADAAEQLRVELLHPGQLLGGGAGEHKVGILIHQGHHVGERPGALADGFAHRPQPGGVDVGVAGGHQLVGGGVGGPGQHLGQGCPPGGGGARDVVRVHGVHHPLQRAEDLVAPRLLHGELVHQPGKGPDVLLELPHGLVEFGDGDAAQPVLGCRAGRGLVPVGGGREGPALGDVGVGCRLNVEVHGHAAAQELQRNVLVARRYGLDDAAVRPPGDPLALEAGDLRGEAQVHHDLHLGVRGGTPGIRHLALEPKPLGAPRPAPGGTVFLRQELLPQRFHHGNGFIRDVPAGQGQRHASRVDRGVIRSRTKRSRRTSVIRRSSCNVFLFNA